jgi:hypothetical protein
VPYADGEVPITLAKVPSALLVLSNEAATPADSGEVCFAFVGSTHPSHRRSWEQAREAACAETAVLSMTGCRVTTATADAIAEATTRERPMEKAEYDDWCVAQFGLLLALQSTCLSARPQSPGPRAQILWAVSVLSPCRLPCITLPKWPLLNHLNCVCLPTPLCMEQV